MRVIRILIALYFLISIRSLGQEVFEGVATLQTYIHLVLAVAIVVLCCALPWKKPSPPQK